MKSQSLRNSNDMNMKSEIFQCQLISNRERGGKERKKERREAGPVGRLILWLKREEEEKRPPGQAKETEKRAVYVCVV